MKHLKKKTDISCKLISTNWMWGEKLVKIKILGGGVDFYFNPYKKK